MLKDLCRSYRGFKEGRPVTRAERLVTGRPSVPDKSGGLDPLWAHAGQLCHEISV